VTNRSSWNQHLFLESLYLALDCGKAQQCADAAHAVAARKAIGNSMQRLIDPVQVFTRPDDVAGIRDGAA